MTSPSGFQYIERLLAPRAVEFYVRTTPGHRIIRIYLDHIDNPRVIAFNESNHTRSPATLVMSELTNLIERAKTLTGVPNETG